MIEGQTPALRPPRTPRKWKWWTAYAAILVVVLAGGYGLYREEAGAIRAEQLDLLHSISALKTEQITAWRHERLGDAQRTSASPSFKYAVRDWLGAPTNPVLRKDLVYRLSLELESYGYADVLLLDPAGAVLLAVSGELEPLDPSVRPAFERVLREGRAVLSDIYLCSRGHHHLDALAPIAGEDGRPIAVIILRCDTERVLFPMIQSRTTPSLSAETLLVRREGDDILFLNELRHQTGSALRLRIPLDQRFLPAVQAVLGREGAFEGLDYRGIPVLAHLGAIPDSPWFMVTKVDQSEIAGAARYRVGTIAVVVALIALLAGLSLGYLYRQRQAVLYRSMYQTERAAEDRVVHLNLVLRAIRDVNQLIVHEKDPDRLIQRACEILIESRGYRSAWVALGEATGEPRGIAGAGFGAEFEAFAAGLRGGAWPRCRARVQAGEDAFAALKPEDACPECPLQSACPSTRAVVALRHEGRLIGLLGIALPEAMDVDAEERDLLLELAGDLAYACQGIETDRLRGKAEADLHRISARHEAILNEVPDIVMEVDTRKVYTFANPAGYEFFGADVIGREAAGYFLGEQDTYARVQPLFNGDAAGTYYVESWQRRRDGERRLLGWWCRALQDQDGRVTGALSTARDLTEQRRADEALRQAQKLEAVGQLAAGIAHDFNNLLTGILGYVALAELNLGSPQARDDLAQAKTLIHQGADLTQQLLGFARRGPISPMPLDLNPVLERTARLFGRTRKDITLHFDLVGGPAVVLADRTQVDQALLNLFVNAGHAMPEGGDLFLRTQIVEVASAQATPNGVLPGRFARLTITDTGGGMDPNTLQRIFEPFFTTKEPGRGTGLGLASVYGIVRSHGGFVSVESELGRGATFTLFLPVTERAVATDQPVVGAPQRGTETILVVDDEAMILEVCRQSLEAMGYQVLTAQSGQQALEVFRTHQARIAAVVLDLIMPGMGGGEVFERLRMLAPEVKVILASGYSLDGQANQIMQRGCNGFIQKPFSLPELSAKIREVLGRPSAT